MPKALLQLSSVEKGIEFHVFSLPKLVRQELSLVTPDLVLSDDTLLILSLFRTQRELCAPSQLVNEEKDHVLSQFIALSSFLREALLPQGFWLEAIDPATGVPMYGRSGSSCSSDVEMTQLLLQFELVHLGNCSLVRHPQWGFRMYPTSMLSSCPLSVLHPLLVHLLDESASAP